MGFEKKILVIGGYGFMGKNLQEAFVGSKYQLSYESRQTGFDLTNLENTITKLEEIKPDIIIHAAAHVGSIDYVTKFAADVVYDNTLMYLNLYRAIEKTNTEIRVINPISNCSYPGIIDVQDEKNWWDGPIHDSVESYGHPKKMGYIISECFRKQHGIKTTNLIMPNAYGPNDYILESRTHAMNGIIMRMIKAQRAGDSEFVVWGTGKPIREWIFMPDMAVLIKSIIDESKFDLPNPINVGQESGVSIIESVYTIKEMLKYDVNITTDLTKQDGAPVKVLGSTLFKEHFDGFKFTGYPVGIARTIEYYKKQI